MVTMHNYLGFIKTRLKKDLGLPHSYSISLINEHFLQYKHYYIPNNNLLNDKGFSDYLNVLSALLINRIDTTGSNPLAIIANKNFNVLLPSEVFLLYQWYQDLECQDDSLNLNVLLELGTLDQIFSLCNFESGSHSMNMTSFRQLFRSYINIHSQSDGKYLVVIRELDSLAYSTDISLKIQNSHMQSVTRKLIRAAENCTKISAISFEKINNCSALTKNSPYFNNEIGCLSDSNFQELINIKSKRNVLAFDCSYQAHY